MKLLKVLFPLTRGDGLDVGAGIRAGQGLVPDELVSVAARIRRSSSVWNAATTRTKASI